MSPSRRAFLGSALSLPGLSVGQGPLRASLQSPSAHPFLDVQAYGAAGDGVSDDSVAFQAAIVDAFRRAGGDRGGGEASSGWGGGVFVPPTPAGYALARPVLLLPGVHLWSSGARLVALQGTPRLLETGVLIDDELVSNRSANFGTDAHFMTRLSGFHLVGEWTSEAVRLHNAIRGSSIEACYIEAPSGRDGLVLSRCFGFAIRSVHVEGPHDQVPAVGVRIVDNCNSVHVSSLYVHGCTSGLKASRCQGLRLANGCIFERATIGVDLQDESRAVSVEGCYVEANQRGIVIGAETVGVRRVYIDGCFFAANTVVDIDLVGADGARIGEGNILGEGPGLGVRTTSNALGVIVEHGLVADGDAPWLDRSRFETESGIVVHRALQTSGDITARTDVRERLFYNGSLQGE